MKLYYAENKKINSNKIIVHNDNSFGYQGDLEGWDFQVILNSSASVILNFNLSKKQCTSCEGYINLSKMTSATIHISDYVDAILMIELTENEKNPFGCHYDLVGKSIFDKVNKRMSIGEIDEHNLIRFGVGQYASFANGKLIGIIIDFS